MSLNQIAYTLDSDFYISAEIHQKELDAIFFRSWQFACHESQIDNPGDYFSLKIGTQEIFLIRGKDDIVRGFFNVCPHRAHPLVTGCGNKQKLACPYHAWTFFLNGELCKAEKLQGIQNIDLSQFNLTEVRVEEFLGFYFVNLDEKSPSLKNLSGRLGAELTQANPELHHLVHCVSMENEVKANWKVIVDNYLDDHYFSPLVNLRKGAQSELVNTHGIYSNFGGLGFWLWPNLFILSNPLRRNITVIRIDSVDEKNSRVYYDVYCVDGAQIEVRNLALKDLRAKLNQESITLCEGIQKGMMSKAYRRGPLIVGVSEQNSDNAIFHFHALVQDALSRFKYSKKLLRLNVRDTNISPV